jgi:beta-glucanase (GH16 family)
MNPIKSSARLALSPRWLTAAAVVGLLALAVPALAGGPGRGVSRVAAPVGQATKTKWRQTSSQDFNGTALPSGWTVSTGNGVNGWGHHALMSYQPGNVRLDGHGTLVITAAKAARNSRLQCWNGRCQYTSGRVQTSGVFPQTYGRFAARIRLPIGQGIWPGFWMLGPKSEIDVVETIGRLPRLVQGYCHSPTLSGGGALSLPQPLSAGYHVYGVDWTPTQIVWWVDGTPYARATKKRSWTFNRPMQLVLSLQVGGTWPGSPNSTTRFPTEMDIDWVRTYTAVK